MRNLLWIVSTFSTLPTATIILEHEVVHQDVQTLYSFSIGSYIKMVMLNWSSLSMSKIVPSIQMGLNRSYSCLWYLDLWFIKACLVGQCLWHIGQENPEVETCLASTWFCTWDIFFELYPHSVHCQRPSSFLNMRLSTRMFRASIVSAWGPSSRGVGYVCSLLINFEHIWHHAFCTDGTWGNCVSDKIVGRWSTQNQKSADAWPQHAWSVLYCTWFDIHIRCNTTSHQNLYSSCPWLQISAPLNKISQFIHL